MHKILGFLVAALALLVAPAHAAEVLRVGTNAEFAPFELINEKNEIVGFDIDIIKAVGRAAGFEVKMVNQAFDTLIGSLENGRIDAAVSGMTITPERQKKVLFSDPYYDAAQVLVVQQDRQGITIIDDLKGKKVAVQLGTTGAAMAEKTMGKDNPAIKQYRKYNEVFFELKLGRVDAVVVDMPVAKVYVKKLDGLKISSKPLSQEQFGIAVSPKNTKLHERLNAGLKKIKESGEFDTIMNTWFDE